MIRNIIFDMGNVLLRFDKDLFIQRLGVSPEDGKILMVEVFCSLEWSRMDRGSMTEAQAAESICRRVPERLHQAVHSLTDRWERPILPVEGTYELVEELKNAGYGIYLLSNASLRQHFYWPRVPGNELFDGTLISSDVGLVKPQLEIYHLLLEKFSLKADECFFVDDSPMNIEGAYFCGIPGAVFFGDSQRLRRELREAGVEVSA